MVVEVEENPYKVNKGIKRIFLATLYSYQGLYAAARFESAFRQEALLAVLMAPCAFILGQTLLEIIVLFATLVLVLVTELLNSAIEAVVDRISYEWHELAKRAKDYGSAAVHLTLLLCGGTWGAFLLRWILS